MDLSIVIVNYNSLVKTKRCLESIFAAEMNGIDFEVIVVDNNSKKAEQEEIKKISFKIKYIRSQINLGMGGGNNLGISSAFGKYILILNPDIVVQADSVLKLFNYLKNNTNIGIIGPKLLNPDGSLQYSCALFPSLLIPILRRTLVGRIFSERALSYTMANVSHEETMPVDWLMGSCLMFRKSDWTHFDERYFMYFEDIDLCRQCWEKGLQVVYYPKAVMLHDHARQSARKFWFLAIFQDSLARQHLRSYFVYFLKWGIKKTNYQKQV